MNKIFKLTVSVLFCTLVGCDAFHQDVKCADNGYANARTRIQHAKNVTDASPTVVTKKGYYADTNPVALGQPAWLNRHIHFRGDNLPFSFMVNQILRETDAVVSYQDDLKTDKPVSMDYKGTIKGALDNLALSADYAYTLKDGSVIWSPYVTKELDISFMPGSSDYTLGREAQTSAQMRGDITTVTALDDSQHSSLKATLSVWKDLTTSLNNLKSKDGTVNVSEATTTAMVHDHPSNVRAIEDYVDQLNKEMSKQVQLKVQVLQVELDKAHEYGIDWNMTQHWFNSEQNLSSPNMFNAAAPAGISTDATSGITSLRLGTVSNNVIIRALETQGKLSVVTEPNVMTMNNQVAEIRITRDTSYLQKSEQSISEGTATNSISPGVVTDGFTLYILPKIKNNQVYLDVSSTIAVLTKLDTINNLGGINQPVNPSQTTTTGLDIITIQVPTLAQKRFNLKSMVDNGSTLVIAGFKELTDQHNTAKMFDTTFLGSQGVGKVNTETVILITPVIIETKK
jgi:type IVB pilus formation R64 PilN family outer membrane protein